MLQASSQISDVWHECFVYRKLHIMWADLYRRAQLPMKQHPCPRPKTSDDRKTSRVELSWKQPKVGFDAYIQISSKPWYVSLFWYPIYCKMTLETTPRWCGSWYSSDISGFVASIPSSNYGRIHPQMDVLPWRRLPSYKSELLRYTLDRFIILYRRRAPNFGLECFIARLIEFRYCQSVRNPLAKSSLSLKEI